MQLNIREAAELLAVDEEELYRLIRDKGLPHVRFNEQMHFHRVDLLEWAQANGLELLAAPQAEGLSFSRALGRGGIHYDIAGKEKRSTLRAVVDRLPLPDDVDPDFFFEMLMAREDQGSTGIGDGIAIPHVRNPIVLHGSEPIVTLCFLRDPVDFDAVDDVPVHALFTMITPTVQLHLEMLGKLANALKNPDFGDAIRYRAESATILRLAQAAERGAGR